MLVYPDIDPVALRVFGFPVHWYGLMYLFALGLAAAAGRRALSRNDMFADADDVSILDFITAAALGVILGGRLGYVVFYKFSDYWSEPLSVFYLWQGGMSFHGGLIGAMAATAIYARMSRAPFFRLTDLAVLLAPPGLGLGRVGNFIGGELPGRVAPEGLPWAMIYEHIDDLPRHPSQLYQAFLEGVVLTAVMYFLARKWRPAGWLSAAFLIAYGALRFVSEFFREPDAHLGLLLFDLTRGQWLSLPMIAVGAAMLLWRQGHLRAKLKARAEVKGAAVVVDEVKEEKPQAEQLAAARETIDEDKTATATATKTKTKTIPKFLRALAGFVFALPSQFFAYMSHRPEKPEHDYEYEEEAEETPPGKEKKGGLWNFFFADAAPPRISEYEEDEDEDEKERRRARAIAARKMEGEGDYAGEYEEEDEDETRARGGLWGFFFGDDEPAYAGASSRKPRPSRRQKRRMKKKKRR